MASPVAPVTKLSLRVRNKALSRAHVRVVEARERQVVEQELERATEKELKMTLGGGISAEVGGLEIGLEAKRGKETRDKTEEKAVVRIQYGKLRESRDWITIDPGEEAILSSFDSPYISIIIEDSDYQLLNQLIHPEEHKYAIALRRANPPFVSLVIDAVEVANVEAKQKAFRLNNIVTKLVLTAVESMGRGMSVGVEPKKKRETHEEADVSRLWIRQMDTLCPKGAFRLVPVAFPDKTLAVSPLLGNSLVLDVPTVETDAKDSKEEARYEQWIMLSAETQEIAQPRTDRGWCSSFCCQPSKDQLLVSPDMEFQPAKEQRRGSSKFDDETVTIKCVGLPDHVMSVKTFGRSKNLVMTKGDEGVPVEALWRCSQPIVTKKAALKGATATDTEEMSLFEASAEGNLEAVLRIIQTKGVKCLQETDEEGFTALHFAAQNGHEDIVREIVTKGGKELIKKRTIVQNKDTPFYTAARCGEVDALTVMHAKGGRSLLEQQSDGEYAIHSAVAKGHLTVVNQLLSWGGKAQLDNLNSNRHTPFLLAAWAGHVDVLRAIFAKGGGKPLLEQQNPLGSYAVHLAAIMGHVDALQQVLE
ncbi:unnamed protein product [Vitrella brassicaformis CCMP3155]|uniref:Uncharacterized protein n=2 Tax=Vitrella brassicaformis TaxID=1169539 RepID=A0A0G4GNI3_VITBC|nr:unnamed protein product [Vitrella brassicaformis CCMP3155]|eukprot:CEM31845.1 unnamed protein product [Vitrella brassicaformis CCMP3155]